MKDYTIKFLLPSVVLSSSIILNINYTLMITKYMLKLYSLFNLQNQVHLTDPFGCYPGILSQNRTLNFFPKPVLPPKPSFLISPNGTTIQVTHGNWDLSSPWRSSIAIPRYVPVGILKGAPMWTILFNLNTVQKSIIIISFLQLSTLSQEQPAPRDRAPTWGTQNSHPGSPDPLTAHLLPTSASKAVVPSPCYHSAHPESGNDVLNDSHFLHSSYPRILASLKFSPHSSHKALFQFPTPAR